MTLLKVYQSATSTWCEIPCAGQAIDASNIGYTPNNLPDWAGAADPGDVDDALDQIKAKCPYILERNTTGAEIVSSNTETSLVSFTIPANTLGTTRMARFLAWGKYTNNTGSNRTMNLVMKLGSTTLYKDGVVNVPTSTLPRAWRCMFDVVSMGATNAQEASGWMGLSQTGASVGEGDFDTPFAFGPMVSDSATVVEDTTGALVLDMRTQHNQNNAALSISFDYAHLEIV